MSKKHKLATFRIKNEIWEELKELVSSPLTGQFVEDALREKLDKLRYLRDQQPKPEVSHEEMKRRRKVKQARLRFFAGLHVGKATEEQVWLLRRIGVKKIARDIPDMGSTEWYWKLHEVNNKTICAKIIPDDYVALLEKAGAEFTYLSEDG